MNKKVKTLGKKICTFKKICVYFCCFLLTGAGCYAFTENHSEIVKSNWQDVAMWKTDGMWSVKKGENDFITFHTDKTAAHNKLAWIILPKKTYRGAKIVVEYRITRQMAHLDLALGHINGTSKEDKEKFLHDISEVWSLGQRPETQWVKKTITVTTEEPLNALAFLSWGHPLDRNLDINLRKLEITLPENVTPWYTWQQEPKINGRKVKRSPVQDFFPFGFYLAKNSVSYYAKIKNLPDWKTALEENLADIQKRGFNCIDFVNGGAKALPIVADLCEKYKLRLIYDIAGMNVKSGNPEAILPRARKLVKNYKDNKTVLTWGFGEEFNPGKVKKLNGFHEMVHSLDSSKTIATIHWKNSAVYESAKNQDVRIAFRDAYPWFTSSGHGPVSYEAQINYYEDEIDTMWKFLPVNASAWSMPAAFVHFVELRGKMHQYMDGRDPLKLRIQFWAGLAKGASGFVYFIYGPSNIKNKGMHGLLDKEGNPLPGLDELTQLAAKIVPLGSILAKLERTTEKTFTDQRDLRAYTFRHRDSNKAYVIVYNRNIKKPVSGRIKVPFETAENVVDMVSNDKISVKKSKGETIFNVSLQPGDGKIISLETDNQ